MSEFLSGVIGFILGSIVFTFAERADCARASILGFEWWKKAVILAQAKLECERIMEESRK